MKVKIERGSSSIEIEGDLGDVERVLERWWLPDSSTVMEGGPDVPPGADSDGKKGRRATRRVSRPRVVSDQSANGFDADEVVAKMKNDPRYELFVRRVILSPKGRAEKAKLVSWFVGDTPLTTGNVQRVLQRLGVKIDPSNVSRAMSGDAKHDYIVSRAGPQPTYTLSITARTNFEQWLLDDARAA
jgi:hypothetical protein